ncbi:MAG TPA: hypothetical protein VIF09_26150 [Polyangiaceae bacterium]|jgi:hypothetical protein
MRASSLLFPLLLSGVAMAAAGAGTVACNDAVHDEDVAALGSDVGPKGPTHRPGEPCLVCHGGGGPAKAVFSFGGTVMQDQGGNVGAQGAVVFIEDIDGRSETVTTNSVGNFFITPDQFAPHYPAQMTVSSSDGTVSQPMLSHVARDGSCADCHKPTVGPASPGPVYLNIASTPDGG